MSNPNFTPLSKREKEVLRLRRKDLLAKQIARELKCSEATIRQHFARAREKLNARNTQHAVLIDFVMQEFLNED
jgi:DNA-binding CsgD family transcriptional regulator